MNSDFRQDDIASVITNTGIEWAHGLCANVGRLLAKRGHMALGLVRPRHETLGHAPAARKYYGAFSRCSCGGVFIFAGGGIMCQWWGE